MHIARCLLTLHDTLFYATREMGTLYETERYIHNYALSYALFNDSIIRVPYFCTSYKPNYVDDLEKLNEAGIYVTPARPLAWDYVMVTWKMAQVTWYRRPERFGGKNYPQNIGRNKEVGPGSVFEFFILNEQMDYTKVPRWVRLGKWMSKAEIKVVWEDKVELCSGSYVTNHPLNPIDLSQHKLLAFDLISMPPVSLINNARLMGTFYNVNTTKIPTGLRYQPRKAIETKRPQKHV